MRILGLLLFAGGILSSVAAQQPTPEQARQIIQDRPDLASIIRQRIATSRLTPEQIRERLRAAGYPGDLLDPYMDAASRPTGTPGEDVFAAVRQLGLSEPGDGPAVARATPPAPGPGPGAVRFGADVFGDSTTQFQPSLAGPVDENYRLGPGDNLVLILTGEVEASHSLEVNREGFIVIPQAGQVFVAGLTLSELRSLLLRRLQRVYSGLGTADGSRTRLHVTVARLRTNQVFVIGDVVRPGSYQISGAGTVLTALYAARGPSPSGSFREIDVRRGGKTIRTFDLYDYLLKGDNASDIRLETGDVIFVPVHGPLVEIAGKVVRPAIYEVKGKETLSDLLAAAGGFEPSALRRRIQINRILPPAQRGPNGRDRVVIDIGPEQLDSGAPQFAVEAGDRVSVFGVAERRRSLVTVRGNVWQEGEVGYTPGMTLQDALRLAGGAKPDVYLDEILISRLDPDSTRFQLRAAFADSTGRLRENLALREDDDITIFSRTTFRPLRYVAVTGAVRKAGRIPYRQGMTLRDAILEADGVTEDALLTEAEIARVPDDRTGGTLARTIRVALDSTYLFDRGPDGRYLGPPGLAAPSGGAPVVALEPYDNILILRQPEWELQRTVSLAGQVRFPGRYALITRSDKLSDLITRAGGLTRSAYPEGVEFIRTRDGLGRIGIDLPEALRHPSAHDNLTLQSGDSVFVPEYNPVVRVVGSVNAPGSVAFVEGKGLDYYIDAAGGYSRLADKGRTYVTQANGSLHSVKRRFLLADGKPTPSPGAIVTVPARDPNEKRELPGIVGSIAQVVTGAITVIVLLATRP
jgi:protein involved in polysaccharide export with SLBB domain